MKRFAITLAFVLIGGVVGGFAGAFSVHYIPHCGYDCEGRASGQFVLFILGSAILFASAGTYWTRGNNLKAKIFAGSVVALSIVVFILATWLRFYLRTHFTMTLW